MEKMVRFDVVLHDTQKMYDEMRHVGAYYDAENQIFGAPLVGWRRWRAEEGAKSANVLLFSANMCEAYESSPAWLQNLPEYNVG